jgi:hypothetical protein
MKQKIVSHYGATMTWARTVQLFRIDDIELHLLHGNNLSTFDV